MERKLRIAQYGCGKMSAYTMRYVYEKGAQIVAALDKNPELIGKDIAEVIGGERTGVVIRDAAQADEVLAMVRPDACIITTMSLMQDVADAFEVCARNGVNAISTCEEAFFPGNSSPKLTKRLDALAREHHCTLCGSGYQDVFWGNLITTLAGATHRLDTIRGRSSYNVEDYGIALAEAHGAGLTLEQFEEKIASADALSDAQRQERIEQGEFLPSYMWNVNGWLCGKLGLTVRSQRQQCIPQTYTDDLYSETLAMQIPAGHATGMSAVVTTQTWEGITLITECVGKVYAPEEFDQNDWTLEGEPNTRVVISRPNTVELTCATVVNRLPDLINAPSGYTTTDRMPTPRYRTRPLHTDVERPLKNQHCDEEA